MTSSSFVALKTSYNIKRNNQAEAINMIHITGSETMASLQSLHIRT